MEQNKAIVILTGGTVRGDDGTYHSTTYEDGDAFGVLGGRARIEAAAILSRQYPNSFLVVTGKRTDDSTSQSHAQIMKQELVELGVHPERIVLEEISTSTKTGIQESLHIADKRGWGSALFVTSDYHVERTRLMLDQLKAPIVTQVISAEEVLINADSSYAAKFKEIEQSPAYQKRIASEKRGIEALNSGNYQEAPLGDKKERLV